MPRAIEFVFALVAALALALPMALLALVVKLTSRGPALHWSKRVGRDNRIFAMPKFRSMRIDTPSVPTHLLEDSRTWVTPIGRFLRRSSLDELPQIWSILTGRMSIVGPRPALFNQDDLIEARTRQGIDRLRPGLTGWAQVNGRDRLSISEKVAFDAEYLRRRGMMFDCRIVWLTMAKVVAGKGVSH